MSITQDIHLDKHTFQFKGFTYLCADEEQQEHDFSALNEEWIENADCTEDSPETSELPDLADHALVLVFRPYKARWMQQLLSLRLRMPHPVPNCIKLRSKQ
jgi:hypothetical protein